jgi:hypothetical protein
MSFSVIVNKFSINNKKISKNEKIKINRTRIS